MPANTEDLPVGFPIDNWQSCQLPSRQNMQGRFCRVEATDANAHTTGLYKAFGHDSDHRNWTYLPYGPFDNENSFSDWLASVCRGNDPLFHSIIQLETGQPVGLATFMRIVPETGVIETGHIHYSPLMQRTPVATEAMYLMMKRVFEELGYRRYEWKCDSLNEPSRRAAERLGFQYEGLFRQATMYKGRNRDTAWFSIIDSEWPALKQAFESWLQADNFNTDGSQKQSLASFR